MSFYPNLSATAARMLGDRGQRMTLRKQTPGAYDPATGVATVASADHAVTGAVFDFPALLIDGTRIQVGDRKVLLAAQGLAVEPDVGDLLLVGSTLLHVIAVKPLAPAGTPVIYTLQARR